MRVIGYSFALLACAGMSTGCATKRYGRLQPLTSAEGQVYDCQDIEVEIAKVEAFRQQVSDGAEFNGASVMGFLGDWGIGNANEKNNAEKTANRRMNELLALKARKGCNRPLTVRTSEPVPTSPAAPDPIPAAKTDFGNRHVKCTTCR